MAYIQALILLVILVRIHVGIVSYPCVYVIEEWRTLLGTNMRERFMSVKIRVKSN